MLLKINQEKSKLILIVIVTNMEDLALELVWRVRELPTTYLGLPLGAPLFPWHVLF